MFAIEYPEFTTVTCFNCVGILKHHRPSPILVVFMNNPPSLRLSRGRCLCPSPTRAACSSPTTTVSNFPDKIATYYVFLMSQVTLPHVRHRVSRIHNRYLFELENHSQKRSGEGNRN